MVGFLLPKSAELQASLTATPTRMHGLPPHRAKTTERLYQACAKRLAYWKLLPSLRRYNVTIGCDPKFMWFRVAKCGTRSIFRALRESGATLSVENGIFMHYRPNAMRSHYKFAFVRNPWDRFVSCFYDRVVDRNHFGFDETSHRKMQNLSEFISYAERLNLDRCDVHLRRQSSLIDLNGLDFLGRMENFEEDLSRLFSRIGLRFSSTLHRENASSLPGGSREILTEEQSKRIGSLYEHDIRLFGYSTF